MKKIIIFLMLCIPFIVLDASAYTLPQTDIKTLALRSTFYKVESYLNSNYDKKISSFSKDNRQIFDNKIHTIQNIFIKIDYLAQNRQKEAVIAAVNELRIDLKDLLYFLNTTKIVELSTQIQELINEPYINLNQFANDPYYGEVTYYADSFEGGKTANGNLFSQKYFSTAKCGISFNKLIQVWVGGKSLIVKVNDRPSCTRFPLLIDLTTTAFDFLHERYVGKQQGEYIELSSAPADYYKGYFPSDIFADSNIVLSGDIPNTYLQNETIHINGELTLPYRNISLNITTPSGKIKNITKYVEKGFTFSTILDETGRYDVRFSGSEKIFPIYVLDSGSYSGKKFIKITDIAKLDNVEIIKESNNDSIYAYRVRIPGKNFNTLIVAQGTKKLYYSGVGDILIPYDVFDKNLPVAMFIKSSKTITGFSHDFYTEPVAIFNSLVRID